MQAKQMAVELVRYESTPQFQQYLLARRAWAEHKSKYAGPDELWYSIERDLYEQMKGLLRTARETPEHLAAFGY